MSEQEHFNNAKKTLLREMIKLKLSQAVDEAQATGHDTLYDQDLNSNMTKEVYDELIALKDAKSKEKIAANNQAYEIFCRSLENLSREANATLENMIMGNLRDANETLQSTLRDANESAQNTIAGNLRDSNETLQNTLRDAIETLQNTYAEMVLRLASMLATQLQTIMDQNDAVIEKSEAEAKQLLLSRSAHRHLRTAGASPGFLNQEGSDGDPTEMAAKPAAKVPKQKRESNDGKDTGSPVKSGPEFSHPLFRPLESEAS
jgi:hypothetical protein